MTRGLARRGIIALVDDATGYQDDKMRQEIDRIIKAYVAPALQPWARRFPFINKYVFDALPPGVSEELKQRLPKNEHGNRRAKLWQLSTADTGIPHLR